MYRFRQCTEVVDVIHSYAMATLKNMSILRAEILVLLSQAGAGLEPEPEPVFWPGAGAGAGLKILRLLTTDYFST